MGPQTLTFGGVLNPTTVTSLGSAPQGRLRATVTTQSDYLKFWEVFYDQSSTGGKTASIQVTAAYRGTAGSVVLDIPDFSAVAGWNSVYGLIPGSTVQWKMTASTWSTTGGVSFPLLVNGATFSSATAHGIAGAEGTLRALGHGGVGLGVLAAHHTQEQPYPPLELPINAHPPPSASTPSQTSPLPRTT